MNIKSIRVKASYKFQSVEIEAEFPSGKPTAEQVEMLQKKAIATAERTAEMVEEKKNEMNFTKQQKKQEYTGNKYKNNSYL